MWPSAPAWSAASQLVALAVPSMRVPIPVSPSTATDAGSTCGSGSSFAGGSSMVRGAQAGMPSRRTSRSTSPATTSCRSSLVARRSTSATSACCAARAMAASPLDEGVGVALGGGSRRVARCLDFPPTTDGPRFSGGPEVSHARPSSEATGHQDATAAWGGPSAASGRAGWSEGLAGATRSALRWAEGALEGLLGVSAGRSGHRGGLRGLPAALPALQTARELLPGRLGRRRGDRVDRPVGPEPAHPRGGRPGREDPSARGPLRALTACPVAVAGDPR